MKQLGIAVAGWRAEAQQSRMSIMIFLAQVLGASFDPFLFVPAIILGWKAPDWRIVLAVAFAIGLGNEVLMAVIGYSAGASPFGHMLAQRIAGAAIIGMAVFGIRRLQRAESTAAPAASSGESAPPEPVRPRRRNRHG